ncbi:phosphatase PAP2 family protein [Paracoccus sp. TOH]|uniref:phosphatase PAP2 family protein n=1 Tax=Paracoccus sp. TOH TaxID=1263728 RepID=UPI0025B1AEF7|nr:phosphatase PAP2 family protein [Paracoccus sp. TOH]WJS84132.1 phosphatase PAP2 family protein [Paracoccus sp. TOH]
MTAAAGRRRCTAGVRAVHAGCTQITPETPAIAGPGGPDAARQPRRNARSRCAPPRPSPFSKYPACLAAGLALLGLLPAPAAADPFEQFGTAMKYGLPLAAAACAADQDRLEDFALRGLLQTALVWAMKEYTDAPIARRPSGQGGGFPSGHTAMAFFGAADLAGKCFEDKPLAGAATYGAAGLTGWSRIHAGEHTPQQVWTGALIGISFGAASFGIGTEGASVSVGMRF